MLHIVESVLYVLHMLELFNSFCLSVRHKGLFVMQVAKKNIKVLVILYEDMCLDLSQNFSFRLVKILFRFLASFLRKSNV